MLKFLLFYIISRFLYDNFRTIANTFLSVYDLSIHYWCDGHMWLFKNFDFRETDKMKKLFIVWPKWLPR